MPIKAVGWIQTKTSSQFFVTENSNLILLRRKRGKRRSKNFALKAVSTFIHTSFSVAAKTPNSTLSNESFILKNTVTFQYFEHRTIKHQMSHL